MSVYSKIESGDQLVVPRPQDYEFFKKNVLEILEGQREARA